MEDLPMHPSSSADPFEAAITRANDFGFNMVYATAVVKSLEAIEETQREYEYALQIEDADMAAEKKEELNYFLNALRFTSLLELKDGDVLLS